MNNRRVTIYVVLIMVLLFGLVGLFEPTSHYTKQEEKQIENNYNKCINEQVEDLTFLAC